MAKSSDLDDRDEADDEPAAEGSEAKAAKPGKAKGEGKAAGKRAAAKAPPRFAPPVEPPRPQGGSLGKSLILFLIIIGGLAAAFAYLGQDGGSGVAPKWKAGQKVELEITLVASDIKDLACWSPEELNGRHCAFESPTKGWSKGDADDKNILRPYNTTDHVPFLASGLWSEPALTAAKLPSTRFTVKCSYTVEGKLKRPGIRWSSEGAWQDRTDDWQAGIVSDCKMIGQ